MQFVVRSGPDQFKEDAARFLASQGRPGFDIVFDSLQGDYFQPGGIFLCQMSWFAHAHCEAASLKQGPVVFASVLLGMCRFIRLSM